MVKPYRVKNNFLNPHLPFYSVEWLVLDEGDKLFEEGEAGFRDQV